jgi:hypothetical protein
MHGDSVPQVGNTALSLGERVAIPQSRESRVKGCFAKSMLSVGIVASPLVLPINHAENCEHNKSRERQAHNYSNDAPEDRTRLCEAEHKIAYAA